MYKACQPVRRAGPAPAVMAEVPIELCLTAAAALDDPMLGPWLTDVLREGTVDGSTALVLFIMLQRSVIGGLSLGLN